MNVVDVLNHFNVDFQEYSASASAKCISVNCPFCPSGDTGKHLGIFRDKGNFSCYKCGERGGLFKYIREVKGITWSQFEAFTGTKQYTGESILENVKKIFEKPEEISTAINPDINIVGLVPADHAKYKAVLRFIEERRFDYTLLAFFKTQWCLSGPWMNRLIIPLPPPYITKKPLCYAARSLSPRNDPRWLFTEDSRHHNILYYNNHPKNNWKRLTIVEGIFDAWAIPDLAVCIFGTELSPTQLLSLQKDFGAQNIPVRIILDGDAPVKAHKLKEKLSSFFSSIEVIYLESNQDVSSCWANRERMDLFNV